MKQKLLIQLDKTAIFHRIVLPVLALFASISATAFPVEHYASESKLATGRWVKISVTETGLYRIPAATLRQWGFSSPERVRICGYGGRQIDPVLSAENYSDDLPAVQSAVTPQGIVFYAEGPVAWTDANGFMPNIYSTKGYYFVTETADDAIPAREIPKQGTPVAFGTPLATFTERVHHEIDRSTVGEVGYLLVGENFRAASTQRISFDTPDAVAGEASLTCAVVTQATASSTLRFSVNGTQLPALSSDNVPAKSSSNYIHGTFTQTAHSFDYDSGRATVEVTYPGAATSTGAWLDYMTFAYPRALRLDSRGKLVFTISGSPMMTDPGKDNLVVWDVTNPLEITAINYGSTAEGITWTNDYHGSRRYAAWHPGSNLPAPAYEGTVRNQNLHGTPASDMVIFSLPQYMAQAQRIADMHANSANPLDVAVVNVEDVYNEFASGSADVMAMRKFLKMLHDRAQADGASKTVRFALLFGCVTYDNRHLSDVFTGAQGYPTIPSYMGGTRRQQLSDNESYNCDDMIGILADSSGKNLTTAKIDVAVGRIPARDLAQAKSTVDKLIQFNEKPKSGNWRNSMIFLADDGDNGIHLSDTEKMIAELEATPQQQTLINKIYVDAYERIGGVTQLGRDQMFRLLQEGVWWWNYSGHANNHSWTGEGMLTYNDINSMYLNRLPIICAATCDFLKWDSAVLSGGEILFNERYGGCIAMISATRPVYISANGHFTRAMGRAIASRDADGHLYRLGELYRLAKNDIRSEKGVPLSDDNRLRYVLMGDPAMMLPMPSDIVKIESIGGIPLTEENQVTLGALRRTTIEGSVCSPDGKLIDNFDGLIDIQVFDAEQSTTTLGYSSEDKKITFDHHGEKLFMGTGKVAGGRFAINVVIPSQIADNFRPATISAYAYTADMASQAVGTNSDFYIYGFDEDATPDDVAPVIESMFLNHESFRPGDTVNESPVLVARVSDDVGVNISGAGVGRQPVLTLDGNQTFTDLANYYQPLPDGTPGGTFSYALENLRDGEHTLSLKVWDNGDNCADQAINFVVRRGLPPVIYDVYSDANPASTEANFYLSHNRPDAMVTVTVSVYNLLGHRLWESTTQGRSEMYLSSPVTWDLTDGAGRRVPRGIYLYRASISTDGGETFQTETRKIAVTAK